MKVQNLINDKGNPASNQFIITSEKGTYFQSYDSVVARYANGRLTVTPRWDYSATTRKHFYIFLRRYTCINPTRENVLRCIANGYIEVVNHGDLDL